MKIYSTVFSSLDHRNRQDLAVGNYSNNISLQRYHFFRNEWITERIRLEHRNSVCKSNLFDRRGLEQLISSDWFVRLCKYCANSKAVVDQFFQGTCCELRCPHKNDLHFYAQLRSL